MAGVSSALVSTLLAFIVSNTPYEMPKDRPEIYLDHPRVIENLMGTAHTDSITHLGAYQEASGRIFLNNTLDYKNDGLAKAKVAHELVHWLQDKQPNAINYTCKEHEEYYAYQVQQDYYNAHNLDSDIDWVYVRGTFYNCRMRGK